MKHIRCHPKCQIQCGAIITRSIFSKILTKDNSRARYGVCFVSLMFYLLPLSSQRWMWYRDTCDRVITALDYIFLSMSEIYSDPVLGTERIITSWYCWENIHINCSHIDRTVLHEWHCVHTVSYILSAENIFLKISNLCKHSKIAR